jgi:hypothetical protein
MWSMKRLMSGILLLGVLLIAGRAASEPFKTIENLRHERVMMPSSTPEREGMRIVHHQLFFEEELGAGVLVFYDDLRTKRPIDYVELYDLDGELLVVSWIDRFGACQAAVDRGLLNEDDPRIDGVLVIIELGTIL